MHVLLAIGIHLLDAEILLKSNHKAYLQGNVKIDTSQPWAGIRTDLDSTLAQRMKKAAA